MKKIIGVSGLDKKKISILKKKFKQIIFLSLNDKNFYSKRFENVNAIIVYAEWPVSKSLKEFLTKKFDFFKNLEWVHLSRAGIDEFVQYSNKYKFKFTCGKIIQGPNVSEHCVALLLSLTRGLFNYDKNNFRPTEIYKKNVLVVGLGGIGVCVAEKINSFGAIVSCVDNSLKPNYSFIKNFYHLNDLSKIVGNYEIVINTTPLTRITENLFNKKIFSKMKQGVFFINVSRGAIVNTNDLKKYLLKNKFAGVGLDIIGKNDFTQKNPFLKFKNVVFTNHMAGITTDQTRRFDLIQSNLLNYSNRLPLLNLVDHIRGF
jgi:phosphoglycerate dehydrogenase-like enzyme